jgi:hypothetical protein
MACAEGGAASVTESVAAPSAMPRPTLASEPRDSGVFACADARTATGARAVRAGAERRGAARETVTGEALSVMGMFASARAVVPEARGNASGDATEVVFPRQLSASQSGACVSRICDLGGQAGEVGFRDRDRRRTRTLFFR